MSTEKHKVTGNVLFVTGSAGFSGMHVAINAAKQGYTVIGIDDLNDHYDVGLKLARLQQQGIDPASIMEGKLVVGSLGIGFIKGKIEDRDLIMHLFSEYGFTNVAHLAAQTGVRYSIDNPSLYLRSNIDGFFSIIEACRHYPVKHLVYASSSSVYGTNKEIPFSVDQNVDHPISLYAATKKSNELMAHTYSHLFQIPTTGLRFFTVYGPWGRPDMALFRFTKNILNGKPIDVYNHGKMSRDFTFIDDIVEGVMRTIPLPPGNSDPNLPVTAPYRICNIGRNQPIDLNRFIEAIELATGKTAVKNYLAIQPGDVEKTYADISQLKALTGYSPRMEVEEGIALFVAWYRKYYDLQIGNDFMNEKVTAD